MTVTIFFLLLSFSFCVTLCVLTKWRCIKLHEIHHNIYYAYHIKYSFSLSLSLPLLKYICNTFHFICYTLLILIPSFVHSLLFCYPIFLSVCLLNAQSRHFKLHATPLKKTYAYLRSAMCVECGHIWECACLALQ